MPRLHLRSASSSLAPSSGAPHTQKAEIGHETRANGDVKRSGAERAVKADRMLCMECREGGGKALLPAGEKFSTDELLKFYGYVQSDGGASANGRVLFSTGRECEGCMCRWFKQASSGDCDAPAPSMFNIEAKAKWSTSST